MEITSARIAPGVYEGDLISPRKVAQQYAGIVPNDEEFKLDFGHFTEAKSDRARYILSELELVYRRKHSAGTESEVAPQWEQLTLEHVPTVTMAYAGIREWLYVNGFHGDGGKIRSDFIGAR